MHLHSLIMMQQGKGLRREQHSAVDDTYPRVVGHRLFPIALLSREERWCRTIAEELNLEESIVANIISHEGGRA